MREQDEENPNRNVYYSGDVKKELGNMYAIRYRKKSTGNEYVRILASWDEAMEVYGRLLSDSMHQIIPVQETGLDIELMDRGKAGDTPLSLRMLSAS